MPAFSVCVDQQAALMAGHDLGRTVTIDVGPADMGENWAALLHMVTDHNARPLPVGNLIRVADGKVATLRDAVEARAAAYAADRIDDLTKARAMLRELREVVAASPHRVTLYVSSADGHEVAKLASGAAYEGYHRALLGSLYMFRDLERWKYATDAERAEREEIVTASLLLKKQSDDELAALNRDALAAALPGIVAARDAARIANETAAAKEALANEALEMAAREKRLSTGFWEIETSGYSAKHYGAPWCASVISVSDRGTLEYVFQASTAKFGSEGILRAPCKPGEIVAWGQKDLRRAKYSTHEILQMQPDGSMTTISKTEAAKILMNPTAEA